MKLRSTVALSFLLLVVMGSAGAASAVWSYALGREALKSVTQPDTSRRLGNPSGSGAGGSGEEMAMLLSEEDILQQVNDIINGKVPAGTEGEAVQAAVDAAAPEPTATPLASVNDRLPIQGRDGDVTLEVFEAAQAEGSLVLRVNLSNSGEADVRFLYSFLAVTDDKGRALSAIADGLPGELPPNGETFQGTIKIPLALIEDAQTLSLSLTDYPDQRLKLSVVDIPVVQ